MPVETSKSYPSSNICRKTSFTSLFAKLLQELILLLKNSTVSAKNLWLFYKGSDYRYSAYKYIDRLWNLSYKVIMGETQYESRRITYTKTSCNTKSVIPYTFQFIVVYPGNKKGYS